MVVPHGEDGDAPLAVDLLDAGVAAGAPPDHAEVGAVRALLGGDSIALKRDQKRPGEAPFLKGHLYELL